MLKRKCKRTRGNPPRVQQFYSNYLDIRDIEIRDIKRFFCLKKCVMFKGPKNLFELFKSSRNWVFEFLRVNCTYVYRNKTKWNKWNETKCLEVFCSKHWRLLEILKRRWTLAQKWVKIHLNFPYKLFNYCYFIVRNTALNNSRLKRFSVPYCFTFGLINSR